MSAAAITAVSTMRAALLQAPRQASVVTRQVPEPGEGEVLVRLEGCGISSSVLPAWEGRPWFSYPLEVGAPGREGWGIEVETGRSVALLSDRAFAEYAVVERRLVVPLPAQLDGTAFPGEAVARALDVYARSTIAPGDTVGIVGDGWLGSLLVQLARCAGARVLVFSRRDSSRALAREFGAETPAEPDAESCDVAIETVGTQETLDVASSLCRTRGRLVIAGFHQNGTRTIDLESWEQRGLEIVNAHERDLRAYVRGLREGVAAAVDGRIELEPLLTHEFPLERLDDAFELLRTRPEGFVKAVVRIP